jgi:hypothetical protein
MPQQMPVPMKGPMIKLCVQRKPTTDTRKTVAHRHPMHACGIAIRSASAPAWPHRATAPSCEGLAGCVGSNDLAMVSGASTLLCAAAAGSATAASTDAADGRTDGAH